MKKKRNHRRALRVPSGMDEFHVIFTAYNLIQRRSLDECSSLGVLRSVCSPFRIFGPTNYDGTPEAEEEIHIGS